MTIKKLLQRTWVPISLAFIAGLLIGGLGVRWHYHHTETYGDSPCNSIDYYDKDGTGLLYSDKACE